MISPAPAHVGHVPARDHLAQDRLADLADLPHAIARGASSSRRAVCTSRSVAHVAAHCAAEADWSFSSKHCVDEGDVGNHLLVGATGRAGRSALATATAEGTVAPEEGIENVAHVRERIAATPSEALWSVPVVLGPLFIVAQDRVGLAHFLEPGLGFRIVRVRVGVQLPRELSIGALEFIDAGVRRDTQ